VGRGLRPATLMLQRDDLLAVEAIQAIRGGRVEELRRLLDENPGLVD
jgi:hypothetical protein